MFRNTGDGERVEKNKQTNKQTPQQTNKQKGGGQKVKSVIYQKVVPNHFFEARTFSHTTLQNDPGKPGGALHIPEVTGMFLVAITRRVFQLKYHFFFTLPA